MSQHLHDLLANRRAELIQRWTETIRVNLAPEAITRHELVDHLPVFLDELTATLERKTKGRQTIPPTLTAGQHGVQRLRLGFDLKDLVWEYGMLRQCIVVMIRESSLEVSWEELDAVFDGVIAGIAGAVTQYVAEREAEQRRQSNEHFAFIAHELRNPLASALLALQVLRDEGVLPVHRFVDMMQRNLARLRDLIEHTLGFAFAGATIELHRKHYKIGDLVAEAVIDADVEAARKEVKIEFQSEGLEDVHIDYRLALSALTNLIRNAVKFTHSKGMVRVRSRGTAEAMTVEVEDECGGLPAGRIDKLFEPFVQAGSDRSGFGLGLAIAKQAVEAHGGSLQVKDLPGQGCMFTMVLPVA